MNDFQQDFVQQTDALRHNTGITQHDARALGARVLALPYTPAQLQAALEWDHDVDMYGLDVARAFQEAAQSTPYSRRQWIAIWTHTRSYRAALHRGEIPDHAAWLARMRRLTVTYRLDAAAYLIDLIEGWYTAPVVGQLTIAVENAVGGFVALWRAIDTSICHHQPACFCRPAPFPAGRDYRRRTKRRRRRQR